MNISCSNCYEVLSQYLLDIPLVWRREIVDTLCQAIDADCSICKEVDGCETVSVLSHFSRVNNVIKISYTNETNVTNTYSLDVGDVINNSLNEANPRCIATVENWQSMTYIEKIQAIIDFDCNCCTTTTTTTIAPSTTTTTTICCNLFTYHNFTNYVIPFDVELNNALDTYVSDGENMAGNSIYYTYCSKNGDSSIIIQHVPDVSINVDVIVGGVNFANFNDVTGYTEVLFIPPCKDIILTLTNGEITSTTTTTSTTSTSTTTTSSSSTTTTTTKARPTTTTTSTSTTTTTTFYSPEDLCYEVTDITILGPANTTTSTTTQSMADLTTSTTSTTTSGGPVIQNFHNGSVETFDLGEGCDSIAGGNNGIPIYSYGNPGSSPYFGLILYTTNNNGVLSNPFDTGDTATAVVTWNGVKYAMQTDPDGSIIAFQVCQSNTTSTTSTTSTTIVPTTTSTTAVPTTTTTTTTICPDCTGMSGGGETGVATTTTIIAPAALCCPSGYTLTPDGTKCEKIETTTATTPSGGTSQNGIQKNNNVYSEFGSYIYNSGFDINGVGTYTQINTNNAYWRNIPLNTTNGPLNRTGLWVYNNPIIVGSGNALRDQVVGFTACITTTVEKTYYVGFGCDNFGSIYLNGQLIMKQTGPTLVANYGHIDRAFKIWHIYPVVLPIGSNILEIRGQNEGPATTGVSNHSPATIGCQIYNATSAELQAVTGNIELAPYLVFDSATFWNQPIQYGTDGSGYTCPEGYALNCDFTCRKTTYTGTVTC